MKKSLNIIFLIGSLGLMSACGSDENPLPIVEEELITTLIVTLTPAVGPTITLQSQDLDGDGPNAPIVTVSGALKATEFYDGAITFLNESVTPVEDITLEIQDEDEAHQVFYQAGGNAQMSVTYGDQDANGNPIGLVFSLSTGLASSGTLLITLRHEPDKNGVNVDNGDITNAGGETDIAQSFSIDIL